MALKKPHPTAFIFGLLLVKAPPEHKLRLSIFILFVPLLEPKEEETLMRHEELWTHHHRLPAWSWVTYHRLMHDPSKGRDAEPQLQRPPQPRQGCTQMVMGLVPLQPAAYAAAAHINADAWRDTPEITGCTSQDFSYAGKESLNPKLPGTAEQLNTSPLFAAEGTSQGQ